MCKTLETSIYYKKANIFKVLWFIILFSLSCMKSAEAKRMYRHWPTLVFRNTNYILRSIEMSVCICNVIYLLEIPISQWDYSHTCSTDNYRYYGSV